MDQIPVPTNNQSDNKNAANLPPIVSSSPASSVAPPKQPLAQTAPVMDNIPKSAVNVNTLHTGKEFKLASAEVQGPKPPLVNGSGSKFALIAIALILIIVAGVGGYYFLTNNNAPQVINYPDVSPTFSPSPVPDKNLDTDKDGLPDAIEKIIGTYLSKVDTDSDGYNDLQEIKSGYSPIIAGAAGKYTPEQWQEVKDKIKAADSKFYESVFGVGDNTTADLQIKPNADFTNFIITNNSIKVGEINTQNRSEVKVFKQIKNNVYLGVNPNGLGGYILYGGPYAIYKIDIKTNTLSKVIDTESQGSGVLKFITDISPDESQLIVIEDKIVVVNISDSTRKEFAVPAKYKAFGDALFSPDGKKIAYAAAVRNPDNEAGEVFIIDIASSNQTSIQTKTGGAPEVVKWIDNNTVDYN